MTVKVAALDGVERLVAEIESVRKDALLEKESGDKSPHSKASRCRRRRGLRSAMTCHRFLFHWRPVPICSREG